MDYASIMQGMDVKRSIDMIWSVVPKGQSVNKMTLIISSVCYYQQTVRAQADPSQSDCRISNSPTVSFKVIQMLKAKFFSEPKGPLELVLIYGLQNVKH